MHPDEGWMYADTPLEIDGDQYLFTIDGTMFTGWHKFVWTDNDRLNRYIGDLLI